jgi:hypothetical protein
MALGAITAIRKAQKSASEPTRMLELTIVGDNAYPTGGTTGFSALVAAAATVREGVTVMAVVDVGGIAGHYPVYDAANDRLKIFVRTTGVEVANTTDLSGTTFRMAVFAK